MGKLDPIYSEFETEEEAEAYDKWFRAQVEAALASNKPRIPHEKVKLRIQEILDGKRRAGSELGS